MMDLIESVTLELRPRLCAAHVYIHYKRCLQSPEVKLVENSVIMNIDNRNIRLLLEAVKIVPTTLSSLIITNNWISFRIQTNPADCQFGTFRAEVLNELKADTEKCVTLSSVVLPCKNNFITFHCAKCQEAISKRIQFGRILPLPRADYEPTEWFCCSHNSKSFSLTPKDTDYFYGSHYFVLNKSVFLNIDKPADCQNCLSILGINDGTESVKIWNCSVIRKSENSSDTSKPFNDFFLAIKESIGPLIGEEILFESFEDSSFKYILLKPVETKVNMLIEADTKDSTSISFVETKAMKVMYICGENNASLVGNHLQAKYCRIKSDVLAAGLEHLTSNSNRIPPNYRVVDEWNVGYIMIPDLNKFSP